MSSWMDFVVQRPVTRVESVNVSLGRATDEWLFKDLHPISLIGLVGPARHEMVSKLAHDVEVVQDGERLENIINECEAKVAADDEKSRSNTRPPSLKTIIIDLPCDTIHQSLIHEISANHRYMYLRVIICAETFKDIPVYTRHQLDFIFYDRTNIYQEDLKNIYRLYLGSTLLDYDSLERVLSETGSIFVDNRTTAELEDRLYILDHI